MIQMIIQSFRLQPSRRLWIEGAPHVSRLDPINAFQFDGNHPARNRVKECLTVVVGAHDDQQGRLGVRCCVDAALGYDPEVSVAVNVSARRLLDAGFPDQVASLLATWEVPAARLVVEITESTIMADPAHALEILGRLNAMGVQLSIDDFGTGYSSMAYLKTLPVHELKVDRSFVTQMSSNPSDATIVHSTVDLGHNLGLRVVAEGVEDQRTWHELAALGCDAIQGYYISKPMPVDDLNQWLDQVRGRASATATRQAPPA